MKDTSQLMVRSAARFNQNVFDAVLLRPGHERPASEIWLVVRSAHLREPRNVAAGSSKRVT